MSDKVNQLDILDQEGFYNVPVQKYFRGREFLSNGKFYSDFCSCNYLSFEFEKEVLDQANAMGELWGSMPCWARMEADPEIYPKLEKRISNLIGSDEIILSHTVTITNFSIIPGIVKKGLMITDDLVHTVVWEACRLARDHGGKIVKFRHQDLNHLEDLLKKYKDVNPKLIAVDGVYSISTTYAHIRELQDLCEKYNAWLYIDDAHGFGVLGENPSDQNPHGERGSGIVAYAGGNYDRTFYVTNFGKAFSAPTAFCTIPSQFKENVKAFNLQYLFSAPPSAHLVGAINGVLDLNEKEGEQKRLKIRQLVSYFTNQMEKDGLAFFNNRLHPVVFVTVGSLDNLRIVARALSEAGIFAGLRAYPVVPPDRCGLRFAVTASNTIEQIDEILNLFRRPDIKAILKGVDYRAYGS